MATPDLAGDAEILIRALEGVESARIEASRFGIEAVHVTARDADAARHMTTRVRSALLAGLATPVLPGCIHVRVAGRTPPCEKEPVPAGGAHDAEFGGRSSVRLSQGSLQPTTPAPAPVPTPAAPVETRTGEGDPQRSPISRPRLVSVDLEHTDDGQLLCRVAVTFRTQVHRAEAIVVDLPGAGAQAAAQAAVRALVDAGIPGLELHGLREVEIAGRDYMLVALRQHDTHARTRSGSAPVIGSPERSAAEATVAAAELIV